MLGRLALVIHWFLFTIGAASIIALIPFLGLEIYEARDYISASPSSSDAELIGQLSPSQMERYEAGKFNLELELELMRELEMLDKVDEIIERNMQEVDWQKVLSKSGFLYQITIFGIIFGIIIMLMGFTIRFVLTGERSFFPWRHT